MKRIFLIAFVLLASPVYATTYYVATSGGSDLNSCIQAQNVNTPKQNFNNVGGNMGAISCMAAGDTLLVRAGTYTDWVYLGTNPFDPSVHVPVPSGISNTQRTIIQGFPGDARPVFRIPSTNCGDQDLFGYQISNFTWDGIDLNGDGLPVNACSIWVFNFSGGQNFTMQNTDVYSCPLNCVQVGDQNGQLININFNHMRVHDCGKNVQPAGQPGPHAMYTGADSFVSSNVVFDSLEFYNNNDTSGNNNAEIFIMYHLGGSNNNLQDFTLRNSYFHDNGNQAILVGSGTNLKVYNNVIITSGINQVETASAISVGYNTADNVQIYNNTLYNNNSNKYAIAYGGFGTVTNLKAKNNLIFHNGQNDAIDPSLTGSSGASVSNNFCGAASNGCMTSPTGDPLFVSASSNNFHLTAGSPARHVGTNLSTLFTTDKDGLSRPGGSASWDDGAYAFHGSLSCNNTSLGAGVNCLISTTQIGDGNNAVLTGFNATGATFLHVNLAMGGGSGITPCTLSSVPANTWNPAPKNLPPALLWSEQQFYAWNANVSSSMTISCTGGVSTNVVMTVEALTGLITTQDPLDQTVLNNTPNAPTASLSLGPLTQTNTNELLVVGLVDFYNNTLSVNNGFTVYENTAGVSGVNYGNGLAMTTKPIAGTATTAVVTPDVPFVAAGVMNAFATTPLCTGSHPNLVARTWAIVSNCLSMAQAGDTITVNAGTYTVTQKIVVNQFVKIIPSGSVTLIDNTCPGACGNGTDHTLNMIDLYGQTTGSVQFGNITSGGIASGFTIQQGTAIHSNPNGVIHIYSGVAGDGQIPVTVVGNSYSATAGSGDFIVGEGDRGVLAYNSMTAAFGGASCLNNNSFARLQSVDSPWVQVSKFGILDTNGDYRWYIDHNSMTSVLENVDVKGQARVAFRGNTLVDSPLAGLHGADTETYGGRYAENLGNTFSHNSALTCNGNDINVNSSFTLRGGTAMVFNNNIPPLVTVAWGTKIPIQLFEENIWRNQGPWACWGTAMQPNGYAGYPDVYQVGWGYITGATKAGNAPVFLDREPLYLGGNVGGGNYDSPSVGNGNLANACGSTQTPADYIKTNREYYRQNSSYNGTDGTGTGIRSLRPTTCTVGTAWWATDQGTWNLTGSALPGNPAITNGVMDLCTATNTWTNAFYIPYRYPHPLISNLLGKSIIMSQQPTGTVSGQNFSPAIAGTISTGAIGQHITLAKVSGSGNPTGTLTVTTTTGGAFTFPGVGINGIPGFNQTWKVTDTDDTTIPSLQLNTFTMFGTQSFTVNPTNITGGTLFAPQPQVTLLVAAPDQLQWMLVNCPNGNLTGPTTLNANNSGVATAVNLGATGSGTTCTITSTDLTNAAVNPISSLGFNITQAAPAVLSFTIQPVTSFSGVIMAPFQVSSTSQTFNGLVTLVPNNCGANFNPLTSTALNGVANFTMTVSGGTGINCNFAASATGQTGATSSNFSIVNPPINSIPNTPAGVKRRRVQ